MTTWSPVTGLPIQYSEDASGTAASGHYLKFYASGTTTPINMATDSTGGTTLAKCQLNSLGQAINGSSAVFIPHIDQKYKAVLYPDSTTADANTFASAIWVVDGITDQGSAIRSSTEYVKDFDTMAAAIASTTLVSGDVILVKDRNNSHWDVSSSGSANTYNVVYLTGSTLYATLREGSILDAEAFGMKTDGTTDSLACFTVMIAKKKSIQLPSGLIYSSGKWSTSAAEEAAVTIRGAGTSRTVLMFRSTDGVELLGTACKCEDMTIVDGDSYATLPTTTAQAVDNSITRGNITAGTVGLRLDRNYVEAQSVHCRGFEIGILNSNTKFYMTLRNCRATSNEYGHVNGNGLSTDTPNFCMSYDCGYSSNFGKDIWIRSGFHIYTNTSTELCTDYSNSMANFPNGGIHIEFGGHGIFNMPYAEQVNFFNASPKTQINDIGNIYDCVFFAPTRITSSVFSNVTNNLILPPWERTWRPSVAGALTITSTNTFLNEDKRYSRISAVAGAGTAKTLLSHWSSACRGIRIRDADVSEYKVQWGFWFRYVTSNFSASAIDVAVQFIDTAGNTFVLTDSAVMNIDDDDYGVKRNAIGASGTTTATTAGKLVDSGASFTTTVAPGMYMTNTVNDKKARIVAIDSATTLTMEDDIFTSGQGYTCGGWQYRGGIARIKANNSTGVELAGVRFNISVEQAATDCSGAARTFDIAEPEIRFLYAAGEGGQMFRNENPLYEVQEVTIASGAITAVDKFHTVDTEGNAASDDLDTINSDFLYPGKELFITASDSARTVVAKDGTGNLKLAGDFSMDNTEDVLHLVYDGSNWKEVGRSDNGA